MSIQNITNTVEVRNLTVAYDARPVLWDISLSIPKGTLTAVAGPNGAGKTTLLKSMLGLIKPVTGGVCFPEIDENPAARKNYFGYVPQSGSVDWDFPVTARDVVMMGRYGKLGWIRRPGKRDAQLADLMLERVGMLEYASRQISRLSGGQQQRVFLARALAQEAEVYFMDEPFKGVDIKTEGAIIALLKELRERGKTVVVVHHDLRTVPDYFDRVALINLKLIASGPVDEVFGEENLEATYRGIPLAEEAV